MKKTLLPILFIFLFSFISNAQHVFDKGDIGINAGIGVGGTGGLFPSLEFSAEYGAIPTGTIGLVSFGGKAAYKYSRYTYNNWFNNNNNKRDYNYHQFEFGVRAAWHLLYFENNKWDAYAGFGTGLRLYNDYYYNNFESNVRSNGRTGGYVEGFVGGRMMINEGFGFYAEAGYSHTSNARIGFTFLF